MMGIQAYKGSGPYCYTNALVAVLGHERTRRG